MSESDHPIWRPQIDGVPLTERIRRAAQIYGVPLDELLSSFIEALESERSVKGGMIFSLPVEREDGEQERIIPNLKNFPPPPNRRQI